MNYFQTMQEIEDRYKKKSGLPDRSWYKIYYSPVRPSPIVVLGINPGGHPSEIELDGMTLTGNRHGKGAASTSYYENDEHDFLDCDWPENRILKLLIPLLDHDWGGIRQKIVKTNMAFRRSPNKKRMKQYHGMDIEQAMDEAQPFLAEIVRIVSPKLVVLAGVQLADFAGRFCASYRQLESPIRAVNQVVYNPARVVLKASGEAVVVQVAHASQFSWTYDRYEVADRIKRLLA